jgi:hypothetical protein
MDTQTEGAVDWSLVTHEGLLLQQNRQCLALLLLEKLQRLEDLCEVAAWFESRL